MRRLALLAIGLTMTALMLAAGPHPPARAQATQRDIDALENAAYVYIGTVRKNGNQSKNTPVWFTVTPDHVVLIETGPDSWKAKRIRRGSPALIWIGAADGPAFIGKAELTNDPEIQRRIIQDYPQRYLRARLGITKPTQEKFDDGKIVAIKITPIRDLPDGFKNEAGTPAPKIDDSSLPAKPAPAPSTGAPPR